MLTFVDVAAPPGLQFRGQILTPGALFDPADLPRPAVMIECAGSVRTAAQRSRYSFRHLWLLWRFDFEKGEWVEVVRTLAEGSEWTRDLAPIAHRLLYALPRPPAEDRIHPMAERLLSIVAAELGTITREERCHLLAALQTWIAAEIVHTASDLTIRRKGFGRAEMSSLGGHIDREEGFIPRSA